MRCRSMLMVAVAYASSTVHPFSCERDICRDAVSYDGAICTLIPSRSLMIL
jgi:hypothetical protein